MTVTTPGGHERATSAADRYTYTARCPARFRLLAPSQGWQRNGTAQLNATASPPNLELTAAARPAGAAS